MPIRTRTYDLTAFTQGDAYSAFADRRRFIIIDNQLAFITDLIGDGRISGWAVSIEDAPSLEVSVSAGSGIINRFATYTFGPQNYFLTDNRTVYFYMRRKEGIIGGFSGFSEQDFVTPTIVDFSAPATPSGFAVSSTDIDEVILEWDANTEVDFEYYSLYVSTDNISFSLLEGEITDTTYTHDSVEQDSTYYYKISSTNLSGQESGLSSSLTATTPKDLRQPLPPFALQAFTQNGSVQLFWELSPSGFTTEYIITIQELDGGLENVGLPTTQTVSASKNFAVITGLTNSTVYKFSIRSNTVNNITSEPIETTQFAAYNDGPAEVEDIDVTFAQGDNDDINVVMTVSFTPATGPYVPLADRYYIVVNENATTTYDPIVVLEGELSRTIRTLPLTDEDGNVSYSTLSTNTRYIITVVGVDEEGNESNGVITQVRTPVFITPAPISNIQLTQEENFSVSASWRNSSSEFFERNIISVSYSDIADLSDTVIVEDLNIGPSSTYIVPANLVQASRTFTFSITAVDQFDNESDTVTATLTIDTAEDFGRPPEPIEQEAFSGDKQVTLSWEPVGLNEVEFYNIYRAEFSFFPRASNFEKINTIPSSLSSFIDYNVENGTRYIYFVTSTNKVGTESQNPTDDNSVPSTSMVAFPVASSSFSIPENLSVSFVGFDASLTWDVSTGAIDGYEIWRSVGGNYDFEYVASVSPATTSYTDEDIVLESDVDIYYQVRTYRNEAEIFVSESETPPQGSILISKVVTENGDISIDNTVATDILNFEDPLREATRELVDVHKHTFDLDRGVDRRIDLSSSIVVSDFTTADFRTFTTSSDITGALSYIVSVEGDVNDEYFKDENGQIDTVAVEQAKKGVPPFLYTINPDLGTITFEEPLFSSLVLPDEVAAILDFANNPNRGTTDQVSARLQAAYDLITKGFTSAIIRPYKTFPVISISMQGVSETQNSIEAQKLESISANQVIGGKLDTRVMSKINHQGRIQEPLIPFRYSTVSDDRFTFTFEENVSIDSSRTFYDVIKTEGDTLLAAASDGVLKSDDFGVTWSSITSFPTAPNKIFYASVLGKYFALTNSGVYVSKGEGSYWQRMAGLENTKVIRDITEDPSGNLYVSTDLGVYRILFASVSQFFAWEQTSIFGPRSTESYAILYDRYLGRVIVSNELGILESYTDGASWSFTNEFDDFKKIYKFIQSGDYIFALTNNGIYRKFALESFVRVSTLETSEARDMSIFEDRIYITTENGAYSSDTTTDIYSASEIEMFQALPQVNLRGNTVPVTSLSIVDDVLFVGVDGRLFIKNSEEVWIQYQHEDVQIPSVYIDGELQNVGVRYSSVSGSNSVSFDEKIDVTQTVTVAIGYDVYIAQNNGWAFQNFESEVFVYQNNVLFASTDDLRSISTSDDGTVTSVGEPVFPLDTSQFSNYQFPEANQLNSEFQGASANLIRAQGSIQRLQALFGAESGDTVTAIEIAGSAEFTLEEGETDGDIVSDAMVAIDAYLSRLFPEARVLQVEDSSGNVIEVPVELPPVNIDLTGVSYNATDGTFTFDSPFNKYDKMIVDIIGCTIKDVGEFTHGEIEDAMELVNSGLPASLSRVHQCNVVKMGIFHEKVWPGEQAVCSTPIQATYNYPRSNSWYDVLNSTVDWEQMVAQEGVVTCLRYATDAIYIADQNLVLVGGPNGALSINTINFDISFVTVNEEEPNAEIKKFYEYNGDVYAVTKFDIYKSSNYGISWTALTRDGLPDELHSIAIINNIIVIGAEDGLYFRRRGSDAIQWSVGLQTTEPVREITDPDLLFAIVGRTIYFSSDGARWNTSGEQSRDLTSMAKFKSVSYVGTKEGLYKDDGTLYSTNASLSLVRTQDTLSDSEDIVVNEVVANDKYLVAGLAGNQIIRLSGNDWLTVSDLPVKAVHKLLLVEDQVWIFGYDKFVISGDIQTNVCSDVITEECFDILDWDTFTNDEYFTFTAMEWNTFVAYQVDSATFDRTLYWPIKLSTGVPV